MAQRGDRKTQRYIQQKVFPPAMVPKLDEVADGNAILIRFIRSNRVLDIFGENFTVSKDLVYSYVRVINVLNSGGKDPKKSRIQPID
jgi:hypothetical protein